MRYRQFGNTNIKVSEIGFGTWPLAGGQNGAKAYGKTDEEESIIALNYAYMKGINLYDVSDFYGYGYVESLLGRVFNRQSQVSAGLRRADVIFVTKVGLVSDDNKLDFSTNHIVESIEGSLKRLKTDYIDVYMLHCPAMEMLEDRRIQSLMEVFQSEGKIREYGISVRTPADALTAINKFGFSIIEVNYNILDHRAKKLGVFDLCKEKNVATIIRTPLGQGVLSGEFQFNSDESDARNTMSKAVFERSVSAFNKILNCVVMNERTRSQLALQFCLNEPAASCVIPGMKTRDQVIENMHFSQSSDSLLGYLKQTYELSQGEIHIINDVYKEYGL